MDQAKQVVIVPNLEDERIAHIYSPHLANPQDASRFAMEVTGKAAIAENDLQKAADAKSGDKASPDPAP
jgi:hypothetical protein